MAIHFSQNRIPPRLKEAGPPIHPTSPVHPLRLIPVTLSSHRDAPPLPQDAAGLRRLPPMPRSAPDSLHPSDSARPAHTWSYTSRMIVQKNDVLAHSGVVFANLDRQRALSCRRTHQLRRQHLPHTLSLTQSIQPGRSQNDGIVLPASSFRSRVSTLPRNG